MQLVSLNFVLEIVTKRGRKIFIWLPTVVIFFVEQINQVRGESILFNFISDLDWSKYRCLASHEGDLAADASIVL